METQISYIVTLFEKENRFGLYMLKICRDHGLRTLIDVIKENGFTPLKNRKRTLSCRTITYADYADDLKPLPITTEQAESQLHNQSKKQELLAFTWTQIKVKMCFKREGDIYTQRGRPLKLVDKFTYLVNTISSTESNINIQLVKAWTDINRLWKFDLSDKI